MVSIVSDNQHFSTSLPSRFGRDLRVQEPPTIVLADDDHNIVSLLADLLEDEGYRVLCASNGHQALRLCRDHDPSLLITDVMMPGMNGWELISRLQQTCEDQPPVIVMSAVRQTLPVSGVAFVPKPFDLDDMLDRVAAGLEMAASA